MHDLAALGDERLDGRGDAVDQDVDEQAGIRRRRPAGDPRAAHFAGGVVERGGAVAPPPDAPAEHFSVEVGRTPDVDCGNLEVADLAVR